MIRNAIGMPIGPEVLDQKRTWAAIARALGVCQKTIYNKRPRTNGADAKTVRSLLRYLDDEATRKRRQMLAAFGLYESKAGYEQYPADLTEVDWLA